MTQYKTL